METLVTAVADKMIPGAKRRVLLGFNNSSLYNFSSGRSSLGVEVLLRVRFNLEITGTRTKQSVMMRSSERISSPSLGRRDPETERREA